MSGQKHSSFFKRLLLTRPLNITINCPFEILSKNTAHITAPAVICSIGVAVTKPISLNQQNDILKNGTKYDAY